MTFMEAQLAHTNWLDMAQNLTYPSTSLHNLSRRDEPLVVNTSMARCILQHSLRQRTSSRNDIVCVCNGQIYFEMDPCVMFTIQQICKRCSLFMHAGIVGEDVGNCVMR